VLLEGPEEVAGAAARLAAAIEDATHIALRWIMALEEGSESIQRDFDAELSRATDTAEQARRNFRMVAMDAVRADGREPESEEARIRTAAILQWLGEDHLSRPHGATDTNN
jgi:hypothetical protein